MSKVCLIVIDGWGISEETKGVLKIANIKMMNSNINLSTTHCSLCPGNAIKNATTPVMDALTNVKEQYLTVDASGLAVGLPEGLMGNSEVGHFTIGTGRVVYQVRTYGGEE